MKTQVHVAENPNGAGRFTVGDTPLLLSPNLHRHLEPCPLRQLLFVYDSFEIMVDSQGAREGAGRPVHSCPSPTGWCLASWSLGSLSGVGHGPLTELMQGPPQTRCASMCERTCRCLCLGHTCGPCDLDEDSCSITTTGSPVPCAAHLPFSPQLLSWLFTICLTSRSPRSLTSGTAWDWTHTP